MGLYRVELRVALLNYYSRQRDRTVLVHKQGRQPLRIWTDVCRQERAGGVALTTRRSGEELVRIPLEAGTSATLDSTLVATLS